MAVQHESKKAGTLYAAAHLLGKHFRATSAPWQNVEATLIDAKLSHYYFDNLPAPQLHPTPFQSSPLHSISFNSIPPFTSLSLSFLAFWSSYPYCDSSSYILFFSIEHYVLNLPQYCLIPCLVSSLPVTAFIICMFVCLWVCRCLSVSITLASFTSYPLSLSSKIILDL